MRRACQLGVWVGVGEGEVFVLLGAGVGGGVGVRDMLGGGMVVLPVVGFPVVVTGMVMAGMVVTGRVVGPVVVGFVVVLERHLNSFVFGRIVARDAMFRSSPRVGTAETAATPRYGGARRGTERMVGTRRTC